MTSNFGGERNVTLAEAIARWAHAGQTDKNGYDYIDHPRAVFYRVYADDAEDYDGQIVAWLHDVVEDTRVTPEDLSRFFPQYIIHAIGCISRNCTVATDRKWTEEDHDLYYANVKSDPIALRVKLHDIAHNTSPKRMDKLDQATRDRLKKKYAHALEVLQS